MTGTSERILLADVGGTHVRFAQAVRAGGRLELAERFRAAGDAYETFAGAMEGYLAGRTESFSGAALGVAGVPKDGEARLLHRNWTISAGRVADRIGSGRVLLCNDFAALSRSAPHLEPGRTETLWPGACDAGAPVVVGGPGTGFGMGVLAPDPVRGWRVLAGEGGHQTFSPRGAFEHAFCERLAGRAGYVSNELVASGSGFPMVMSVLGEVFGRDMSAMGEEDVRAGAVAGEEACLALCRLRAAAVMTALGNAALLVNARGGVFIAGGVSVRLAPWLAEPEAMSRFFDRGPRSAMMRDFPIRLILCDEAGLTGSAHLWTDVYGEGPG